MSPSAAVGYGGGTISYPTDTSEGPFGALAVCPGYTGVQRSLQWLGPRLASNGFVVIVIDTLSPTHNAEQRAVQLVAALNQVIAFSATSGHPLSRSRGREPSRRDRPFLWRGRRAPRRD